MAKTYTPNLHLAMQQDKTDKLDWDAITSNWQILDSAYASGSGRRGTTGDAVLLGTGALRTNIGIAEQVQEQEER